MLAFCIKGRSPHALGKCGVPALGHCERFPPAASGGNWVRREASAVPWGPWLRGVIATVILSRVRRRLLPLQVEGWMGREERADRCPDRWAWPPALPSLMNFLPGPEAGQQMRAGPASGMLPGRA